VADVDREVMTDHGTQFYANKRNKNGYANSEFENFPQEEIKSFTYCLQLKRPQVNGKIEKWNDTYEKNRSRFDNFDKFMNWYNIVRVSMNRLTQSGIYRRLILHSGPGCQKGAI